VNRSWFKHRHDPEKWVPVFGKDHAFLLKRQPPPAGPGLQALENYTSWRETQM
jgi:hypothetical protein